MLAFAAKRLGVALLVALTVSLITFSMIYVSGDPAIAIAGEGARAEDIEAIRKFYGFDRPIPVQYVDWLGGALHGDFGRSYTLRQPVADVIFDRLPVTMILGASAIAFRAAAGHSAGRAGGRAPQQRLSTGFALTLAVVGQAHADLLVRADADPVARRQLAAAADHRLRQLAELRDAGALRSATT